MLEVTAYGTVSSGDDGAEVSGEFAQLYSWATRPGAVWPCSELARLDSISVGFDSRGDLVEIRATADGGRPTDAPDLCADELAAWTSDVLRAAGLQSGRFESETQRDIYADLVRGYRQEV